MRGGVGGAFAADEAEEDLEDVVGFGHVCAEEALALGGGADFGVEGPGVEDRPDGGCLESRKGV